MISHYIQGDAEVLIGKYFARNPEARSKVFLATKFGYVPGGVSGTPEYVHEACENSLKRLNVSYIDLYYQHRVDAKTPIEKTVGAMAELIKCVQCACH
jgi:aryl-alcohol dehydrogenase-like predicted oxidoreductase